MLPPLLLKDFVSYLFLVYIFFTATFSILLLLDSFFSFTTRTQDTTILVLFITSFIMNNHPVAIVARLHVSHLFRYQNILKNKTFRSQCQTYGLESPSTSKLKWLVEGFWYVWVILPFFLYTLASLPQVVFEKHFLFIFLRSFYSFWNLFFHHHHPLFRLTVFKLGKMLIWMRN